MLPVLRRGAHGPDVELLQKRLSTAGFAPGRIDGRFGPGTEAALLAFQRAHDLLADGAAGPITWQALGGPCDGLPADRSDRIDVDLVAEMFPSTPLQSIRRHLPAVLAALRAQGLVDKPMLLMALATIRAESEGFAPVPEAPSRFNTSPHGHPFDLYDQRRDLGNLGAPDGERFRGRGFVQLTGRANYLRYGAMIGLGDRLGAGTRPCAGAHARRATPRGLPGGAAAADQGGAARRRPRPRPPPGQWRPARAGAVQRRLPDRRCTARRRGLAGDATA